MGTALFPQGLWEQEIGYLLAVPTNLWEQLFPQRLWEHQMGVSHWLFPQICRNGILCLILRGGITLQFLVKTLLFFALVHPANTILPFT